MQNIIVTVKGNKMTLEIDLTKRLGNSASGKNVLIASTGGNQALASHPGVAFGVNVYTKAAK